jgi:orotate phosphoribosyltransferase
MMNFENQIASYLLQIKAIKLDPSTPFTWASGWKSPIYCDNRKILSYPSIRQFVTDCFAELVKKKHPDAEVIAGVATGAIGFGTLVAEKLDLPFVYVRAASKAHGLGNRVEGDLKSGQKTVVIEDLISTGQSSLNAVHALRESGANVLGMLAIFSYGFEEATENFRKAGCDFIPLCNYEVLLQQALENGYIQNSQLGTLKIWRENPSVWGK